MAELARKDYSKYVKSPREAVDFVIMFVPFESSLQLALANDPTLWRDAFERKVFITGEQNLLGILHIIHIAWVQNQQAENQEKVFGLAEQLLDRLGDFMKRYRDLGDAIDKARKLGLARPGFDAAKETYVSGGLLRASGFVEAGSLITTLRENKDAAELKLLRESNRIAYLTYEYIKPRVKTGMTEFEVAAEMERFMRAHGATTTSFYTIVAFGENTANPHHETSARKLKAEDAVLMDFGCVYKGYCSDITRSWWHGKKEPAEYTKIWHIVDKARKQGIKAVGIGVPTKKVDATSRGIISAAGYGQYFTHGTGHGVGIEIHEDPYNSQQSAAILSEGNIVTVEPGIYLPGKYGVRLEDTVAVAKSGAKILTKK